MKHDPLVDFLTSFLEWGYISLFYAIAFFGLALPGMAISITLNVRRMRRAAERIADALGAGGNDARPGRLGI